MRNKLTIILFGLLIAVGWINALAQQQPTQSAAERLALTLVDNVSVYDPVEQTNTYTNTLQLTQPANNKLTAGMLNNGDNIITISRQGIKDGANEGNPEEIARVNVMRTPQTYPTNPIGSLNLTSIITSSGSLDGRLPANWTSTGLYYNRNGYAYIQSGTNNHLSFTIPSGLNIHNGKILVSIYTTQTGYFAVGGWINRAVANSWNSFGVTGVNAGDVITIQGVSQSGGTAQSARMTQIEVDFLEPLVPVYDVTTTLSTKGNNGWSNEAAFGTTSAFSPNDEISLDGMSNLIDNFSVSTEFNAHPDTYSYTATVDANILFPSGGSSETNFYASADYQNGDGTVEGIVVTGPNNWYYEFIGLEDEGAYCLWFNNDGNVLYTMPNDFAGNSVNVTIIADTGTYGNGSMMVNGVSHTFVAGETYTWTVPVCANGTILFACIPTDPYSVDVSKIIISSGNGSASGAPRHVSNNQGKNIAKGVKNSVNNHKFSVINGKGL